MRLSATPIHPFPARMAPEIAIEFSRTLPPGAVVLDPMVGSGTTIRAALDSGHGAIGVDMDPLAVLIARAWTTPVGVDGFLRRSREVLEAARAVAGSDPQLGWIDDDPETRAFTERWFGPTQLPMLRALSSVLHGRRGATWDLCRVALSRTIITKDRGASLARDVSHSRPHVAYLENDYDVATGFLRASELIAKRFRSQPVVRRAHVIEGDCRSLPLSPASVDAVITSPPYLNAIDYLRGHRMSLVWFGYQLRELRSVRGSEIGAERSLPDDGDPYVAETLNAMGEVATLAPRLQGMARRYVADTRDMLTSITSSLRPGGSALFVVGNSTAKGVFLRNDVAVERAAVRAGLKLESRNERLLPPNRRYLPPPTTGDNGLDQRMRSEVVLTFTR